MDVQKPFHGKVCCHHWLAPNSRHPPPDAPVFHHPILATGLLYAADPGTLDGKVMCGYQGWFATPADERFDTPLKPTDGASAQVFSSAHPKTVRRHFEWMRTHGIDGVFLQRFDAPLKDIECAGGRGGFRRGTRYRAGSLPPSHRPDRQGAAQGDANDRRASGGTTPSMACGTSNILPKTPILANLRPSITELYAPLILIHPPVPDSLHRIACGKRLEAALEQPGFG